VRKENFGMVQKANDREGNLEKLELTKGCAIYIEPLI
jgi:hypothetical protein